MPFIPAGFIIGDHVDKLLLARQHHLLVLLRHAFQCRHQHTAESSCPASKHCFFMKRVLSHISKCKDEDCMIMHCVNSRKLTSHYNRCEDVSCALCIPVRVYVLRFYSGEKEKDLLDELEEYVQSHERPRCGTCACVCKSNASPELTSALQSLSLSQQQSEPDIPPSSSLMV